VIVIGFVILTVAVAAAIVTIAQNQSAMVNVHGLGYTWDIHVYWVLVAGLVIAAVGFLGIAMMRTGTAHATRIRVERRGLVRENARLNELAADQSQTPTVVQVPATAAAASTAPPPVPVSSEPPARYDRLVTDDAAPAPRQRHLFHRTSQV